jgi:hypothetical protein
MTFFELDPPTIYWNTIPKWGKYGLCDFSNLQFQLLKELIQPFACYEPKWLLFHPPILSTHLSDQSPTHEYPFTSYKKYESMYDNKGSLNTWMCFYNSFGMPIEFGLFYIISISSSFLPPFYFKCSKNYFYLLFNFKCSKNFYFDLPCIIIYFNFFVDFSCSKIYF